MPIVRGFDFPDGLYYLLEHDVWVRLDADGDATVGMTTLGVHISGEIIEFMAKPLEARIERERALGMLEMSKVVRSVRAPISGAIVSINERAQRQPGLINADPYGQGWLVRMRPSAWDDESHLLVTGAAIAGAVAAYMAQLAEVFDQPLPP